MFLIKIPGTITDTNAPQPGISDPLLIGAGGGVATLFDLAAVTSWPKQAAPVNGDTIYDLTDDTHAKVLSAVVTTTAPTWAGSGFDYSAVGAANRPNVVQGPAGSLTAIKALAASYFMTVGYFKLPARADWNTSGSIAPMFSTGDVSTGYSTEADMLTISQNAGSGGNPTGLVAARQTAIGTVVQTLLSDAQMTDHYGKVAQVAFWRNAAGVGFRVQSSAGSVLTTGTVGAENAADFGAKRPKWGMPLPFGGGNRNGFRVYRGWVENLAVSLRDPATVLAADWARAASRFS